MLKLGIHFQNALQNLFTPVIPISNIINNLSINLNWVVPKYSLKYLSVIKLSK